MASSKQGTGRFGEREAAAYLEALGYRIRERNYRTRLGEIDLVAEEGDCLVFAEVKTRTGTAIGHPGEAVDRRKRRRMTRAAVAYVNALPEPRPWRFDVVEVAMLDAGAVEVRVHRDAFQVDERDLRGLE